MKHKHTHECSHNINSKKQVKEPHKFYDKTFSNENEKTYEINIKLIQPWSVPVLKTTLPPDILQTMIEISDKIIADKNAKSWGHELAGQIDTELAVEYNILEETDVLGFFLGAIRQFVIVSKCQQYPNEITKIQQEEWQTNITNMWIVSQQPGEYNPMHIHTECQVSSVMYLKIPKMLPSRKKHRSDDGAILFLGNSSRDLELSAPSVAIPSQVGDFYIFGANQQHAVYPFRCAEGQEDVERRSISFNAIFQSQEDHDAGKTISAIGIAPKGGLEKITLSSSKK